MNVKNKLTLMIAIMLVLTPVPSMAKSLIGPHCPRQARALQAALTTPKLKPTILAKRLALVKCMKGK